ncbi:hypothetical protein [Mycetocola zhadangensis]|uniref:SAF domain-containing protein n=1 Tax=Mycetocola zhadangensis TaxID=1164595 RepID=A0A3L7ITI8_9MICO|nr:hypothetical protein [Mycetocola zhadangensis]RLQ81495.1 hypothetical protein D9V28_14195 [Mycetocola zhadangensis]GGF01226.1 hypothetical protein GCM10011313_25360 [Mycetocola zhadangensis]
MDPAATLTPVRSRIRLDPRFVVGIALILVSIVGVWLVVQSADRSTPVYLARTTLSVGDVVRDGDLTLTHVRLGEADTHYVADGAIPEDGLVVLRTVLKGELLPQSAVATDATVNVSAIVVGSTSTLPESIDAGSLIDVWSAQVQDDGTFAPPVVLVPGASVVRVVEQQGLVDAGGQDVEILVPKGKVASVLAALAGKDAISVVPATGR